MLSYDENRRMNSIRIELEDKHFDEITHDIRYVELEQYEGYYLSDKLQIIITDDNDSLDKCDYINDMWYTQKMTLGNTIWIC